VCKFVRKKKSFDCFGSVTRVPHSPSTRRSTNFTFGVYQEHDKLTQFRFIIITLGKEIDVTTSK
jgi:hypothetical protein